MTGRESRIKSAIQEFGRVLILIALTPSLILVWIMGRPSYASAALALLGFIPAVPFGLRRELLSFMIGTDPESQDKPNE